LKLIDILNMLVKNAEEDTADYYDDLKDLEENLEQQEKLFLVMESIISSMQNISSNSVIDNEFIELAKNIVSTDKEYVKEQLITVRKLQNE
ncbi:MAG: hypothetical protein KAH86_03830, partial [Methanosarcinales archaeon]|nr:hypothetical protein [Methanosarcinales archaeon]